MIWPKSDGVCVSVVTWEPQRRGEADTVLVAKRDAVCDALALVDGDELLDNGEALAELLCDTLGAEAVLLLVALAVALHDGDACTLHDVDALSEGLAGSDADVLGDGGRDAVTDALGETLAYVNVAARMLGPAPWSAT